MELLQIEVLCSCIYSNIEVSTRLLLRSAYSNSTVYLTVIVSLKYPVLLIPFFFKWSEYWICTFLYPVNDIHGTNDIHSTFDIHSTNDIHSILQ